MSIKQIIFLNNIYSPLSYHIIETLRNDHQKLEDYDIFIGTSQQVSDYPLHSSIRRIYDINKQGPLLCRNLLECSLFIFTLQQIGKDVQYALRAIKQRAKCNLPTKIICLSNYMTWAHSKQKLKNLQKMDKQQIIKTIKQSTKYPYEEQRINEDTDYPIRKPHFLFRQQYQIQNRVLELQKYNDIQAYIICCGLIYGKNFPQKWLHQLLAKAYTNHNLPCYGNGLNFIPLTNLTNLLEFIETLKNHNKLQEYYICTDQCMLRQSQIISLIQKYTGNQRQIDYHQIQFSNMDEVIMSENVLMKPSRDTLFQSNCRSFDDYLKYQIGQLFQEVQISPIHMILDARIIENEPQIEVLLQRTLKLIKVDQIILSKIQQLQQQAIQPKNQINIFDQKYLQPNKYSNYIIINRVGLVFEMQILQKYNIITICDSHTQVSQNTNKIQYKSPQYYKLINIPEPIHQQSKQDYQKQETISQKSEQLSSKNQANQENTSKIQNQHYELSSEEENYLKLQLQKVDNKTCKVDQYLIDNVTSYISEAYLKLNGQISLTNLISQLKKIYDREYKLKIQD